MMFVLVSGSSGCSLAVLRCCPEAPDDVPLGERLERLQVGRSWLLSWGAPDDVPLGERLERMRVTVPPACDEHRSWHRGEPLERLQVGRSWLLS